MVGISFLGKKVIFAQHRDENDSAIIQMIGQIDLPVTPDIEYVKKSEFVLDMTELFGKIKNVLRFPDRQFVSVSIPSDWLHYYVTTVEKELDSSVKREFLHWEFHERLGEPGTALKSKHYSIGFNNQKEHILTIGYPKNMLSIFRQVTEKIHFSLKVVDIDVLSVLSCVPNYKNKYYICRLTEQTLSLIEVFGNDFKMFLHYRRPGQSHSLKFVRGTTNSKYATKLQEKLEGLLQGKAVFNETFWFYGSNIPESIQSLIQSEKNYNLITPFYGFDIRSGNARSLSLLDACQYAEAIGIIRQGILSLT